MRNNVKIWKVCRRDGDRLVSVIPHYEDEVTYAVGKLSRPNIGENFLFAFDSLESAQLFSGSNHVIFEARGNNVREEVTLSYGKIYKSADLAFPRGTVFCSSIKLIKQVS